MDALFDAVDFGLLLIGPQGQVERANRWICERTPAAAALAGQPLDKAFGQSLEPRLLLAVRSCLDLGNAIRLSQAFHPMPLPLFLPGDVRDRRLRQSVDIIPVERGDADHAQRCCLIQVRDVTESVRREQMYKSQAQQLGLELARLTAAHQEIERQSARFREMARLAPVGLFETDLAGRLTYCNSRVSELLGLQGEPLPGQSWTDLFALDCRDFQTKYKAWEASVSSGVRFVTEFCMERPGQRSTWLRVETTPARPQQANALQGHIFTLMDVTELREQARRHEARANHDKLTGLVNRDRFEHSLTERLQRLELSQPGARLTVMFIDLDRFKQVNDGHGHHAGDLVLRAVASRVRRCVRGTDLVARLGGDEFAVLLGEPLDPDLVAGVAERVRKTVAMPINVGSCHVQVGASIGWASASAAEGPSATARLLQEADAAMYACKRERLRAPGTPPELKGLQGAGAPPRETLESDEDEPAALI